MAEGDKSGQATAHLMRAWVLVGRQDLDPEACLEISKAAVVAMADVKDMGGSLEALKIQHQLQSGFGQHDAAMQTAKDILMHCTQGGDRAEIAAANLILAEASSVTPESSQALQAARQASSYYEEAITAGKIGSTAGKATCTLLLAKIFNKMQEFEAAIDESVRAFELFKKEGDQRGQSASRTVMSAAFRGTKEPVEALRMAEEAARLAFLAEDPLGEAEALVAVAESQVDVVETLYESIPYQTVHTIVKTTADAVSAMKTRRPREHLLVGTAYLSHARALLHSNAGKGAWMSAKSAAKCFRKAGENRGRARALVSQAQAELRLGQLQEARASAEAAFAGFEKVGDSDGKQKAFEVSEQIMVAMGYPTQAELKARAEQQQLEMMRLQQQQMMLMAQQGSAQRGQLMTTPQAQTGELPESLAKQASSRGPIARDGSPLDLGKGLDSSIVLAKIKEIAMQIIGDTDEFEEDLPLMEAGLTSNTAILLRDELSKDLPGVRLPPTLIFDYPSVGAITEFVMENSGK